MHCVHVLRRLKAPCKPILTIRKLKTVLPQLKEPVEIALKSRIVYKLVCSRCGACYVGQTDRHLLTRLRDHLKPSQPVGKHTRLCEVSMYVSDNKTFMDTIKSCSPLTRHHRILVPQNYAIADGEKHYIGSTERTLKTQFTGNKASLTTQNKSSTTSISKYI